MKIQDVKTVGVLKGKYIPELYGRVEIMVLDALMKSNPNRGTRFFVGKTLYETTISLPRALKIFEEFCKWNDFDIRKTEYYLSGVYHMKVNSDPSFIQGLSGHHVLSPDEIKHRFLTEATPWLIQPPNEIDKAAYYFCSVGGHPIPVKEGKLPAIKWKEWQDNKPPLERLKKWDWSKGIILLGTDNNCFLDIDIKSDKHPDGIENFNESELKGWYFERTKNGGYHVFGKGKLQSIKGKGIELLGKGRYIVTYPTPGYVVMS